MVCLIHGLKFHPDEDWAVHWALVIDGVLFVVAVFAVRIACEWFLRWRGRRMPDQGNP
jgi:hypothetical protein